MARIIFFEVEDWETEEIKKNFSEEVTCTPEKLTQENVDLYKDAEYISPFIYSTLTRDVLSRMPNLKGISTRSTGYDHIDVSACHEKGIVVSNVPSYGAASVAEFTFALILALSRKIVPSINRTRTGDFSLTGLMGFDLSGKTIGVVGVGNIGSHVVKIAQSFNMKIIINARHEDPDLHDVTYASIEDLLKASDIVTLHVPLTPETKHLINRDNIKLCKKGSLLINTARGGLIETQAILEALDAGIIAGAGLDVLEEEYSIHEERELLAPTFLEKYDLKTQLLNHVLLNRQDVLITPHNAFHTKEALQQILTTTVGNIHGLIEGKPQSVVN